MIKNTLIAGGLLLALATGIAITAENKKGNNVSSAATITPPSAEKIPHKTTIHGDTRVDNYHWLRDDERKDPKVIAYLNAENQYAKETLAHTEKLQEKLFNEINGRIKKDDSSVPVKVRGYYYQARYEGEKEYAIHVRKKTLDGKEQVLLDGNKMAEGHDYFAIGDYSVSTNDNLLAYSTDTLSRRIYTIYFRDLSTGKAFSDKLEGTEGSVVWANDNQTVFYVRKDPQTLLGDKVYRHKLGTPQSEDVLVYEEKNKLFYTSISKSKDESLIVIYHSSTTSKGQSILDANAPNGEFRHLHPLEDNLEYSFQRDGNDIYLRTNWQATNFRLMKSSFDKVGDKKNWEKVGDYNESIYLRDFELFKGFIALNEKVRGQDQVILIDRKSNKKKRLSFNDSVYVTGFTSNLNLDTSLLRIYYSSPTTPSSIYDVDMTTEKRTLLKQTQVLGDFNPENYHSKRIFITARDGEKVPVTLVYRKDKFKQDGSNPLYQYGYGSYGITIDPSFSSRILSILDRGFVYAIAHIRGSQMLGRPWYEDGKLFNKKNTFTDFIDVTKALIDQKYANPKKIFAAGGSAGGLLMGAVINEAPELYTGIGAHVPFVDVVTTMLDASLPLTTNEYKEWGNPNEEAAYKYMLSYSPYDNVKKQNYPNMLVTTGLHDSQVQYFEPAKWVAKLRDYKTDSNRLLFKTDMEAGHGGASGRFRNNKRFALEYAFFLDLAGIKE